MNLTVVSMIVTLLCAPIVTYAGNIDSLTVSNLIERALDTADQDMQQGLVILNEAKQKAKLSGDKVQYADVLFELGVLQIQNLKYAAAIENFTEAGLLYGMRKNNDREARCYAGAGLAYRYLGDYSQSLRTLFKGLSIADNSKNESAAGALCNNISMVYMDLSDWDNAIKYARRSINLKTKLKDTLGLARSYNNRAEIYLNKKKHHAAIEDYRKAIDIYRQITYDADANISISNMANVFFDLGLMDSAIYYKELAVSGMLLQNQSDYIDYHYAITTLGDMLVHAGRMKEAAKYVQVSENSEELMGDYAYATNYYTFLYDYFKKKGDVSKALMYMEKLSDVKDSLNIESAQFEKQRIALNYEFDQKSLEDSLRYQLKISRQEIAAGKYRNRMYSLAFILLVIVGTSLGVIWRVNKIQKNKRHRELENMRNDIAGDLHDDIGSTLSSIQIISTMMATQSTNVKMKEAAETISRLSDKVAGGIREIVWSVNPINDNLGAIVKQLRKLAAETLGTTNASFSFDTEIENPDEKLLPETRKNLIMIYKEAINNARKYSETTQLDIIISQRKSLLDMIIKDYGIGFDIDKAKKGNGLANMERRALNMNAKLTVTSKIKVGTVIRLEASLP